MWESGRGLAEVAEVASGQMEIVTHNTQAMSRVTVSGVRTKKEKKLVRTMAEVDHAAELRWTANEDSGIELGQA